MPDITLNEKKSRNLLIGKSYEYLNDNFHKFKENNRIKVALEIIKKSMPTQLEHSGDIKYTRMTSIVIEHKTQELDFGEDIKIGDSRITADTREVGSNNDGDQQV